MTFARMPDIVGFNEALDAIAREEAVVLPDGELERVFRWIAAKWQREAKRRAPVAFGDLRNKILKHVHWEGVVLFCDVGSNMPYSAYVEFGTKHIAGGKVKALGDDPLVTDAMAVHIWPAKAAQAIQRTSVTFDQGVNRRRGSDGKFRGPQEQMPWLRPAFNAIRPQVINRIEEVVVGAA